MKRLQRIRKALALVSAAVLIAAFVLYRAGFGPPVMSSSKSTFIFVGSSVKPPEAPAPAVLEVAPLPHEAKPNE